MRMRLDTHLLLSVASFGALCLSALASADGAGWDFAPGLELGGGRTGLSSSKTYEIKKSGSDLFGRALVDAVSGPQHVEFSAGLHRNSVDGSDDGRGLKQEFKVTALHVGLSYCYEVRAGVGLGAGLDARIGQGVTYDVATPTKKGATFYVRPFAQYFARGLQLGGATPFARVAYANDLNIADRNASEWNASLGFALALAAAPSPAPTPEATLAPTSAPEAAPPPAPEPTPAPTPFTVQLDSKLVSFEKGSAKLDSASQERLTRLGAVLAKYGAAWSSLAVSGHTDASGKVRANEKLSRDRADSVRSVLVGAGASADKITAEGFASTKPLPGKSPKDGANRRVELGFGNVEGPDAANLQRELMDALK